MARAKQFVVDESGAVDSSQALGRVVLVDEAGEPIEFGGGGSVAWGDVTGKPSTFAPATHEHAIADVTGLQSALDAITDRLDALEAATDE